MKAFKQNLASPENIFQTIVSTTLQQRVNKCAERKSNVSTKVGT